MKINTAQIVSDCSFVQYFSMCCPFSAITNRPRDRNPSMALSSWSLVFQSYYHLKKDLLAFRHCYVTMSIERPIIKKNTSRYCSYKKKVTLPAKQPLNALCEKRLQSSMLKWTSFYNFSEFHCKILNSYAIYRCKKTVKILNCYLYAKKSYGTLSKGAIFFGQPCILGLFKKNFFFQI